MRLVVLVSHPIQYFAPIYRALAARSDIDLEVLFHCRVGVEEAFDPGFGRTVKWDIPLLGGYRHRFLSSRRRIGGLQPRVVPELLRAKPDVLFIHGYTLPTNLAALVLAKVLGIKVMMRGDTRLSSNHSLSGPKAAWKRLVFRALDGFVSVGRLNADYYAAHGVPRAKIHFAPYCVSNSAFRSDAATREQWRVARRNELGIPPDAVVILFAAKFIARKRSLDLVRAFDLVQKAHGNAWLLFIGSGEQEEELKLAAQRLPTSRVVFAGFRNQSELPSFFAASDLFVLPAADEPWGLAVNEVMAAGLPVVVSDEVGAAADLVAGRDTGFVHRCGDVAGLAAAISKLVASKALRTRMGRNAEELIAAWDVEPCAEAMAQAAAAVASGRAAR